MKIPFFLDAFDKELRTIKYFGNGDYLCVDQEFNIYKAYNNPQRLVDTEINLTQINSIDEIEKLIIK